MEPRAPKRWNSGETVEITADVSEIAGKFDFPGETWYSIADWFNKEKDHEQ